MKDETTALTVIERPVLTPNVWSMLQGVALAAHESRKFNTNPGEAAIKLLFCYENGLPLSAANTSLYVVNGRLAVQSNIIAAQLRSHPNYDYRIKDIDDRGCTVEIMRLANGEWRVEGAASFAEADAKRAGLLGKDNWKSYPADMYFNRALARAQRRFAPDIFSQTVYMAEELMDGGNVLEGSYTVEESNVAEALQLLSEKYGPEAILAASDGRLPDTAEAVATLATKLAEEAGDDVR